MFEEQLSWQRGCEAASPRQCGCFERIIEMMHACSSSTHHIILQNQYPAYHIVYYLPLERRDGTGHI